MKDFKCMLAKPLDEKKLKFPCLISPKLDGIRVLYYKGAFYTRNKKPVRGLESLEECLAGALRPGVCLDGELLIPGLPFQKSSGLIRSFNSTPEAEFHVFDLPLVPEPQLTRFQALQRLLAPLEGTKVQCIEHVEVNSMPEVHEAYRNYRSLGFEGAMVKAMQGRYTNSRSWSWMKMKNLETYDVLCSGFFEGQGRLTGTLGGIIVELDEVSVRVGGGFSDAERDTIWSSQEEYKGMICEIAGQELTPSGSLRHPRFITWRTDI